PARGHHRPARRRPRAASHRARSAAGGDGAAAGDRRARAARDRALPRAPARRLSTMREAWRTLRGVVRSLRIYYGNRERRAAMERHYGAFIRPGDLVFDVGAHVGDRIAAFRRQKSTRLNSSHVSISYAVFCLKKKKTATTIKHP